MGPAPPPPRPPKPTTPPPRRSPPDPRGRGEASAATDISPPSAPDPPTPSPPPRPPHPARAHAAPHHAAVQARFILVARRLLVSSRIDHPKSREDDRMKTVLRAALDSLAA